MGGSHWERLNCKGLESILKICIKYTRKQVVIHMCGFDGVRRGNYFGGDPIGRTEIEVRGVLCLKTGDLLRLFHCAKI